MRGNPRGHAILDFFKLTSGDVGSDQLAAGGVLLLIRPLDGCGQIKPVVSLHVVVRYALADGVEHAEKGLCSHVSLLGGLAIPLGGLRHIAGEALAAVAIERGEMHLACNGALIGGLAVPCDGLLVVLG